MILVSACLAGVDCAWDGKNRLDPETKRLVDEERAIAICPEVIGGRPVPRRKTEIRCGSGEDVLEGKAKVCDENGNDVTIAFLKGARAALEIVRKHNIKEAFLKSKSPSCGVGMIYDGSFEGRPIKGNGVTTALLKREGIECHAI